MSLPVSHRLEDRVVLSSGGNTLSRCFPVGWTYWVSLVILSVIWIPVLYGFRLALSASALAVEDRGFSLRGIGRFLSDTALISALYHSFLVALGAVILSFVFGGLVAIGSQLYGGSVHRLLSILYLFPLVTPDVMIGLGIGHAASELQLPFGLGLTTVAHGVFASSLMFFVVSAAYTKEAATVVEAAQAVGSGNFRMIMKVTKPLLVRPLFAGALVAFVVSLDDFAVTYFLSSAGQNTLPVVLFSHLNKGLRPEHFAAASALAIFNMVIVAVVVWRFGLAAFGLEEGTYGD